MNKDSEGNLTNAITALHQEIKKQGENTRKELGKINLSVAELRLSYMKLDDSFNKYAQSNNVLLKSHETRIIHLEEKNFGTSVVSEPRTAYKKRKRKK